MSTNPLLPLIIMTHGCSSMNRLPELYILSQGGTFHPLAAQPHIEGDEELSECIDPEEKLEICGDLIAWSVATDSTNITVINWKTGRTVWSSGEWVSVRLLH